MWSGQHCILQHVACAEAVMQPLRMVLKQAELVCLDSKLCCPGSWANIWCCDRDLHLTLYNGRALP
jgi:hypothetical protein